MLHHEKVIAHSKWSSSRSSWESKLSVHEVSRNTWKTCHSLAYCNSSCSIEMTCECHSAISLYLFFSDNELQNLLYRLQECDWNLSRSLYVVVKGTVRYSIDSKQTRMFWKQQRHNGIIYHLAIITNQVFLSCWSKKKTQIKTNQNNNVHTNALKLELRSGLAAYGSRAAS